MGRLTESNRGIFRGRTPELRESRLRKAAELILQEPPGKLLDIGCADGAFGHLFIDRGFEVHGVELSEEQVGRARQRGLHATVHDLSAARLPYDDSAFDVVYAGEVVEHVVDTTAFLEDARRVLRASGALILTTPNLASFENRLRLLLGMYPKWVEYRLEGGHGHVRSYTPRALFSHLAEIGFAVEEHRGNWVPFVPQRFADDVRYPGLAITGDMFPSVAMDIIVKARKVERAT